MPVKRREGAVSASQLLFWEARGSGFGYCKRSTSVPDCVQNPLGLDSVCGNQRGLPDKMRGFFSPLGMGRSLSFAVVEIRMTGKGGQVGERVSGSQEPRGGCSGQSRCFWKQTEEVEWWGQVHDLPNATNHHL